MKIIVFSDSHGRREDMVLTVYDEHPDAVFFLGDGLRDTEELEAAFPDLPLYRVAGNCDWTAHNEPFARSVTLDEVCFYLCHGHTFDVKNGYYTAIDHARKAGAQVLLCGHTHRSHYEDLGDIQLLNPGSIGEKHTYGLITTRQGTALCSVRVAD